jgi:hydroxymethylglutaryl-CoA lyase
MLRAVADEIPMTSLAVHFHDTRGQALANVLACLEEGVRVIDASVSGAGGCPYAQGASGNVASEDVIFMLQGLGFETGVALPALIDTGRWLSGELGRTNGSKLGLAGLPTASE